MFAFSDELKKLFIYRHNRQYWNLTKSYNLNTSYNSPLARLRKNWNLFALTKSASVPISKFKSLAKTFC